MVTLRNATTLVASSLILKNPHPCKAFYTEGGHARKILQNTNQTIAEIAYLKGFNDPSYFTRVFSKKFGGLHENFHK
jgi:hypothetical protein